VTSLRPQALRKGDVVTVASLAGSFDTQEAPLLERGIAVLTELGFDVRLSPLIDIDREWWWSAARPREIADEFNRLLRDRDVRAIFGATGGRTTLSYLDLVDTQAVRSDPKFVVGMSDVGALLLALHARTGLVGLHGELVTFGFGTWSELDDTSRAQLTDSYRRTLTSDEPLGVLPQLKPWQSWRGGRAEGPLIGGLLNRLVRLQATPLAFEPERFDGAILFWEEVGGSMASLWNDLHVLRMGGILDRIAGMVVGAPSGVEPVPGGPDDLRDIALEALGERDIPVIGNVDIGHAGPNLPVPLGIRAALNADGPSLTLLEPATRA